LVQSDFKFVIGYSSVSHMGFVLLGLMTLNQIGLSGAVYQMFSHGVLAGLLFAVVGRMVYDRTHTRELSRLDGFGLGRRLPLVAVTFVVAGAAAMGLPGFSGFVAELQVLMGAWRHLPVAVVVAGFGVLVGVAYTLRVIQRVFLGESDAAVAGVRDAVLPAVTWPERFGAGLLVAATLGAGLYPRFLLDLIGPSLHSELMKVIIQ